MLVYKKDFMLQIKEFITEEIYTTNYVITTHNTQSLINEIII
jgi:hypothetical protein